MCPLFPLFRRLAAAIPVVFALLALSQPSRADFAISEIFAVASLEFPDEDGEPSDWIEITNAGSEAASLAGHYLTNTQNNLTRWACPDVSVGAGAAIVIYASAKNRSTPGSQLHTNFTLDRGGDYLALIAPDGLTPVAEFAPAYPEQYEGVAYGVGTSGAVTLENFVELTGKVRYFVPSDDSLGDTWKSPGFDDVGWSEVDQPVGWESLSSPTLTPAITTDISEVMKGANASGYFRFPFQYDATDRQLLTAQLSVTIDDGFVAYLNGVEVASLNDRVPLEWDTRADGSRQDTIVLRDKIVTDLTAFAANFVNGQNVLAVQAMNTSPSGSDFLLGAELAYEVQDISGGQQLGFLTEPTPGSPNGIVFNAPPADVEFSLTSQMFTEDFQLTLSCATPGATIRYTTDLSVPSNELGSESPAYNGPIPINGSTQVRARAFLPGSLPGAVDTQTFLKMDANVASFSSDLPIVVMSTLGGGAPYDSGSTLRRTAYMFFFEPDPDTGRATLTQAPSVTSRAGIRKRGSSSAGWPKYAMSIETWTDTARDLNDNGVIDLEEEIDNNIEPLGFAREADWILSARWQFDRALIRNPFIYDMSRQIGRYAARTKFVELFNDVDGGIVDDNLANRTSRDYFGVYTFMEKIESDPNRVEVERLMPWDNSEPEVTGGYIFKRDRNDAGGPPTYNVSGAGGQLIPHDPGGREVSPQQKSFIEGYLNQMNAAILNRPSGINTSTGLHWSDYLDIDSFIDHHWLNTLAMNVDWGRLSAYYHKDRSGPVNAGPIWDFDRNMGSEDGRDSNPRRWDGSGDSSRTWFDSRYPWFGNLIGPSADPTQAHYPDVRQAHTDRWSQLRKAAFSTENIHATIDGMADELREAQARNFVRWSDRPPNGGQFAESGTTGWEAEISHMKGWMEARAEWIDSQYMAPPSFNSEGGVVPDNFPLIMTSPDGPVYYTLDGSDPRAPGGGVAEGAIPFDGGPVDNFFLGEGVEFKYLVPADDSLGDAWAGVAFDDGAWMAGTGGAGWESLSSPTLTPEIATNISATMKGTNASGYFRYEFEFNNSANVNSMALDMLIDDGFVAYLNGVEVASLNAPASPAFNSTATGSRTDGVVLNGWSTDITSHKGALVDGVNVLAIQAMNTSSNGSDFLVRPALTINNTVTSEAIQLSGAVVVTARTKDGDNWSAPGQVGFVAGTAPADGTTLVVSKLMYRPADATPAEEAEGYSNRDRFEWIEVMNIGDAPVALVGVTFIDGIDFDFDSGAISSLAPGERALVIRDLAAFTFRYGAAVAGRVAGEFANNTGLSNDGEQIVLQGVGGVIRDFTYNDRAPWPESADGDGFALVLIEPESNPDHAIAANWQSSAALGGSPGVSDGQDFTIWRAQNGDVEPSSDDDGDNRDAVLEFAQGTDPAVVEGVDIIEAGVETFEVDGQMGEYLTVAFRRSLTATGVDLGLEVSTDAQTWSAAGAELPYVGEVNLGDGTGLVIYRSAVPFNELPSSQLIRLRATLR